MDAPPMVFLVGENNRDHSIAARCLDAWGLTVESFTSPQGLLNSVRPATSGCFVLDLHLTGMTGLELRRHLLERDCRQPFILLLGHSDIASAVEAVQLGAIDVIEKPFDHVRLITSVRRAIAQDAAQRRHAADQEDHAKRLAK